MAFSLFTLNAEILLKYLMQQVVQFEKKLTNKLIEHYSITEQNPVYIKQAILFKSRILYNNKLCDFSLLLSLSWL